MMRSNKLLEQAEKLGFASIDSFVEANLHYLPKEKQQLFYQFIQPDEMKKRVAYQKNGKSKYIV